MPEYSKYEQKLFSVVEEHGWQFTFVFDPKGLEPDFGYSIGFTSTLNAPEFVIFGLPRNLMNNMLWEIYNQIEKGAVPADGMRWQDLLEGFDCISRKATHKELHTKFTVSADWYWKEKGNSGNPEVYQIVWPGAQDGLFPWDNGCAQDVIDAQPRLWISE